MARLPVPGSDEGTWGDVLNEYLGVSHKTDGTLKDDSVTSAALAPGAVGNSTIASNSITAAKIQDATITEAKLDSALQTKVNSGGGSIADGSITPAKLNSDTPVNGEVLSYNSGSFEWVTPAASGGSGEANTMSNIGSSGVGVYKQKTGVDFEVKKIQAGSNKITVTDNTGANTIDIDVATANFGLTKSDVGLANVDNTSDANKPVSTATQTALNAKADATVTVSGGTSLSGGGNLTTNRTITLVNDAATPGNDKYYGTNGTGTKGYYDLPAGGSGDPSMGGDLSGTASNAQIVAGAVDTTELADSAVTDAKVATGIAQSKIANLTSDLAGKASSTHTHAAADITSGTIGTARLGSGTANSTTYLRGDGTWAAPGVGSITYADVPAGSTFTVYKTAAGSWPGARPSARTDIYFIFKGPGVVGTGTSPESIMLDGDDWQILP